MTPEEAGTATSAMWEKLAQQLADAVPDLVITGDIRRALEHATAAEACFWQSTGEGDAWNVKDVMAAPQPSAIPSGDGA